MAIGTKTDRPCPTTTRYNFGMTFEKLAELAEDSNITRAWVEYSRNILNYKGTTYDGITFERLESQIGFPILSIWVDETRNIVFVAVNAPDLYSYDRPEGQEFISLGTYQAGEEIVLEENER